MSQVRFSVTASQIQKRPTALAAPKDSESFPLRPDGSPYRKGPVWAGWYSGCRTPADYLRGWWLHSYARKLAQEICNFPRRILATLQRPSHVLYCFPPVPDNLPARSYLESCSRDIESLREEYAWAGDLDLQVAARAYQLGCRYVVGIYTQSSSSARERKSCDQFSQVPDVGTDASSHSGGHAQG